jgi:hypothetical protein
MARERDRFITGALGTGLTEADAEDSRPSPVQVCRAHAAPSPRSRTAAWLRLRYPAHYLAGLLNNSRWASRPRPWSTTRRHGLTVLGVDVNRSAWERGERITGMTRAATSPFDWDAPGEGYRRAVRTVLDSGVRPPVPSVRDFVARSGLAEPV